MRCLVVGPAKCGTTALFTTVASAMGHPAKFFEEPLSSLGELPSHCVVKVILGKETNADVERAATTFDRKVLILRDPRDNLVSRVLYEVADRIDLLADDAFTKRLLGRLMAKQASPSSVDMCELAHMFDSPSESFVDKAARICHDLVALRGQIGGDWEVIRYEEFVDGKLAPLSRYLGLPLCTDVAVDREYSRVTRTKSSGDWQHWCTSNDVTVLRPAFAPLLRQLGYEDDWSLAQPARIAPEHSFLYVSKLIDQRRHQKKISSGMSRLSARQMRCNICGSNSFGPGPNNRMAETGVLPACRRCGSLERQRIVRKVFEAMPVGFLGWRRALQFSPDNGVPGRVFESYEVSVFGGENHLDIQDIDRPDGIYDFVSFSHVLEFVPDDIQAFSELSRILSPNGVIQACFSTPLSRNACIDYAEPFGPHGAWHLYGADLSERFKCAELGLAVLTIEEVDPVTGAKEIVHLFLREAGDLPRIRHWLSEWSSTACVLSSSVVPAAMAT